MILANCLPHYVFLFPGLVNCNGLCGFHNTKMNRFRGIGLPTAFSKASGMYYILISLHIRSMLETICDAKAS